MLENGMRLRITSIDKDFTILDAVSDKHTVYSGGMFISDQLNHEELIDNLMGVEDMVLYGKKRKSWRERKTNMRGFSILEREHCRVDICCNGDEMTVTDHVITCGRGFDKNSVITEISYLISVLGKESNTILTPKTDTCRLISDLGLFVIKDNNHMIVLRNCNRSGNVLVECLYDKMTFPWLYVDMHESEDKVRIFNHNFNEVAEFAYDESFAIYFADDKDIFEEELKDE